jgi:outer membrane protein
MRSEKTIFLIILCIGIWLVSSILLKAQSSNILDNYIKQGLQNNYAIKQKELNLEKSLDALKEANGLFYPSVALEAQYYLAKGGRSIELPVGDMLNPVYSTLNQILQSSGQPGNFPQIENENIEFLPNDYHDTRVRVIMPLINAEIYYNRKIKKELLSASQAEINVYKRELVKEIKVAYFRYLQSIKVVEAYKSALELVNEALRVNTKLVENQMAGYEKVYRIDAELKQVTAQLTKAENDRNTATSYFNFLINQPLLKPVMTDSSLLNSFEPIQFQESFSPNNREEIGQLNSYLKSSEYYVKLKQSWLIPTVTNITDLGYQGYSYSFNPDQQYIMNTINLSWPIFSGFQNRSKISQARIEKVTFEIQLSEAEQQIELQSSIVNDNFESSLKSEEANKSSLISSKEYYKVISKQYAFGQKSLLDLLDARNQLTSSEISYTISRFETLIKLAELERANASYDLNSSNN